MTSIDHEVLMRWLVHNHKTHKQYNVKYFSAVVNPPWDVQHLGWKNIKKMCSLFVKPFYFKVCYQPRSQGLLANWIFGIGQREAADTLPWDRGWVCYMNLLFRYSYILILCSATRTAFYMTTHSQMLNWMVIWWVG